MLGQEVSSVQSDNVNEAKWYVINTYSGYENKVASDIEKVVANQRLEHLIFEVCVPTETVLEVREKGKVEVKKTLFPGYVFVLMILTDESWYSVRSTKGCSGFVGPGGKPQPLSEEEVAEMGIEKRSIKVPYSVGDRVDISEGPFEGFEGVVEDIDEESGVVKVKVSMFGRETPVELRLEQATLAR